MYTHCCEVWLILYHNSYVFPPKVPDHCHDGLSNIIISCAWQELKVVGVERMVGQFRA